MNGLALVGQLSSEDMEAGFWLIAWRRRVQYEEISGRKVVVLSMPAEQEAVVMAAIGDAINPPCFSDHTSLDWPS